MKEVESAVESRFEEEETSIREREKERAGEFFEEGRNLISFSVAEHGAQRGPRFPRYARRTGRY